MSDINNQIKIIQELGDIIVGTSKNKITEIAKKVAQDEMYKARQEINKILSNKISETEKKITEISQRVIKETLEELNKVKKEISDRVTDGDLHRLKTQLETLIKEKDDSVNEKIDDIKEELTEAVKIINDKIKDILEKELNEYKNEINVTINNIERDMEKYKVEWISSIEKKIFEVKESMRRAAYSLLNIDGKELPKNEVQDDKNEEDKKEDKTKIEKNKSTNIIKNPAQLSNIVQKTIPKNPK